MRLFEFTKGGSDAELKARILTVLEFLRNRAHDKKIMPAWSTPAFINMVNNQLGDAEGTTGLTFELLQQIKDSDRAIGQLVTDLDKETIQFKLFGDEPNAPQDPEETNAGSGGAKDPTKTVDAMAKRAASNRT
jgi:hypothetical protein